jgi:hypothetical protein
MTNFTNQQRTNPYTLNHPSDLPCDQTGSEVQKKSADENFNFVQIGKFLLPVSFISAVQRNLKDVKNPNADVESRIEASFWNSLNDVIRGAVGPTIDFIQEHGEWIEALQQEIAQRAASQEGSND